MVVRAVKRRKTKNSLVHAVKRRKRKNGLVQGEARCAVKRKKI